MIHGHGGNIYELARQLKCPPEDITDVSSNINPLGPPPGLMDRLKAEMGVICSLPEVDSAALAAGMAESMGVDTACVLAGAGTTQFIYSMFEVLGSRQVLIVGPTYADYADACDRLGLQPSYCMSTAQNWFQPDMAMLKKNAAAVDTVVICNPNNPTGGLIPKESLLDLCRDNPRTRFAIDESYLPFAAEASEESMAASGLDNVIVLHSMSKIYRLPGLRIGFVIASPDTIDRFRAIATPWNLNSLAQAAVRFVLKEAQAVARFVAATRKYIADERRVFNRRLEENPALRIYPSTTSFFLIGLPDHLMAAEVCAQFARQRILVRNCSNFRGLNDHFIRIALHRPEVNQRVADILEAISKASIRLKVMAGRVGQPHRSPLLSTPAGGGNSRK